MKNLSLSVATTLFFLMWGLYAIIPPSQAQPRVLNDLLTELKDEKAQRANWQLLEEDLTNSRLMDSHIGKNVICAGQAIQTGPDRTAVETSKKIRCVFIYGDRPPAGAYGGDSCSVELRGKVQEVSKKNREVILVGEGIRVIACN